MCEGENNGLAYVRPKEDDRYEQVIGSIIPLKGFEDGYLLRETDTQKGKRYTILDSNRIHEEI